MVMWRQPWENSSVEVPVNGYDYIIYTDGENVYAKNGKTGDIDIRSDDLSEVLSEALANSSGIIHISAGKYDAYTPVDLPTSDSSVYPSNFGWIIEGDSSYDSYARGTIINLHGQSYWWKFQESDNGYGYYTQTTFRNLSFIGTGVEDVITYETPSQSGSYSEAVFNYLRFYNVNRAINYLGFRYVAKQLIARNTATQAFYFSTGSGGIGIIEELSSINNTSSTEYAVELHGNGLITRLIDVENSEQGLYVEGSDIQLHNTWLEGNSNVDMAIRAIGAQINGVGGSPAKIEIGNSEADSANIIAKFYGTFPSTELTIQNAYDVRIHLGWYASNWYSKINIISGSNIKIYGKGLQNEGIATFSGDGSTTQFTIAHGLVAEPSYINITPLNGSPWPDSITKDDTNITLTFNTAPASGTTLTYSWEAHV